MNKLMVLLAPFLICGVVRAQNPLTAEPAPIAITKSVNAAGHELITFVIPGQGDEVAWADVGKAIVRAIELDDSAIADMLPPGKISLRSPTASLILMGAGLASKGDLKFAVTRDATGNSALTIICDRTSIKERRLRKADMLLKPTDKSFVTTAGITLDDGWQQSPPTQSLVVCVHGYSSGPGTFSDLRDYLRGNHIITGAFGYDFHQKVEVSAKQLAAACLQINAEDPNRSITLVAHSMGGLVCRAMLEFPGIDPGNIKRLITVATPHGGSMWAHCPPLLSARDENGFDMNEVAKMLLGAGDDPGFRDLKPDSAFLSKINALPRNSGVHYTAIIGDKGPLSEQEARDLRDRYAEWKTQSRTVQLFGPKFDPIMSDLAEVTTGLGDGAVAVCRTEIAGVEDVIRLPFSHSEVLRLGDNNGHEAVWQAILKRCQPLATKQGK